MNIQRANIQRLLTKNENKLTRSFNFTFCYIDDVYSRNNSTLGDFVDCIYHNEFEIKDTTYKDMSASYLDIEELPFMCSIIPAAPTYGVYIS